MNNKKLFLDHYAGNDADLVRAGAQALASLPVADSSIIWDGLSYWFFATNIRHRMQAALFWITYVRSHKDGRTLIGLTSRQRRCVLVYFLRWHQYQRGIRRLQEAA